MRPNRLCYILKSSMNTVIFVNTTIGSSGPQIQAMKLEGPYQIHVMREKDL